MTAGFALVELFTSEGCSSCPPADDVLAAVADRRTKGEPVFALGFHVDYWDHLGWRDPFGSAAWTQRQSDYARILGLRGLYTPQVIVSGAVDIVGSRRRAVNHAIDAALRRPAVGVTAACEVRDRAVVVTTDIDERFQEAGLVIVAALSQASGSSAVTRGENAGKNLTHVDIVRSLGVAAPGCQIMLDLPSDVALAALSVVTFAHDRQTMRIVGGLASAITSPAEGRQHASGR